MLLYDASSEEEILSGNPDFVLDCIDNIDTKVTFLPTRLACDEFTFICTRIRTVEYSNSLVSVFGPYPKQKGKKAENKTIWFEDLFERSYF